MTPPPPPPPLPPQPPSSSPTPRSPRPGGQHGSRKPPLRLFTTTLWEYPSQHYDAWVADDGRIVQSKARRPGGRFAMQGDKSYEGATPSWVIWQLLSRYTRPGDVVLDPMCGSGTTIDVAHDLDRKGVGYDLSPSRSDIQQGDARRLPAQNDSADFVFIDPPYSTHIDYSDDPACIGKLDAAPDADDGGKAYYEAMDMVLDQAHRVLRNRRYMALYVSDSWRKRRGQPGGGGGVYMPIGFELFAMLCTRFTPIDTVCVVRQNTKLSRGNWHKAAAEQNFFLRGFNYLFIMKKVDDAGGRDG